LKFSSIETWLGKIYFVILNLNFKNHFEGQNQVFRSKYQKLYAKKPKVKILEYTTQGYPKKVFEYTVKKQRLFIKKFEKIIWFF